MQLIFVTMNLQNNEFNDSDYSSCVARLIALGIRVVAFDMDQTAVSQHSRGRLKREDLNQYLDQATPDFLALVPLLYSRGLKLAIATHSDEAEFGGEVQPETHILGEELARALVQKHFSPQIASAFHLIAYNPRHHGSEGQQESNRIKRYHMRKLIEYFQVLPHEVLFLDDTKGVVDDCIETCGVKTILVDAAKGFQINDLRDNL